MNAVVLRNSPSAFMNHESGTNFWNAKQDTVSHNSVRLHPVVALIVLIKRNMQHPFSIDVSKYQNSIIQRCAPSFENYWGKSSVFNQQDNKCATNTIQSRMGQSVYKLGTSKLLHVCVCIYIYVYIYIYIYTGCHMRNGPNFGRVFLMLNYTDITQNTYIQSWTVSEIMASDVWNFDSCYTLTDYQIHIETGRNMWFQ